MKQKFCRVLIIISISLAIPLSSHAFNNKIELSYMQEAMDQKYSWGDADYDIARFGLLYTRFLKPLEDGESPYAMREFLQHPSGIFAGYSKTSGEIRTSDIDAKLDEYAKEYFIGTLYYLPSGTGIGMSFKDNKSTEEETGTCCNIPYLWIEDVHTKTITITLNQYLSDNIMLGANYSIISASTERNSGSSFEEDYKSADIHASAFLNDALWVSGALQMPDVKELTGKVFAFIEMGVFPSKKLGLFLSFDDESNTSTLTGDFSLTRWISLSLNASVVDPEPESWYDEEGMAYKAQLNVLF
ncbi:MAG: hypothetical protein KAR83_02170 [Thermodesulfovibrionales bacterium]|nr:hypothetical protein [Thermodesulfovibrionales bacterium]